MLVTIKYVCSNSSSHIIHDVYLHLLLLLLFKLQLITHEFSSISTAGGVGSAFYEKAKSTARAGFNTHVLFVPSRHHAPTRAVFDGLVSSHANENITLLPLRAYADDDDQTFADPFDGGGVMPYARRAAQIGSYVCEQVLPSKQYDIIIVPEVAGDYSALSPSSCEAYNSHRPIVIVELHGSHVWWRQADDKTYARYAVDLDVARLEMDSAAAADFVVSPSRKMLDFLTSKFRWRPTAHSVLPIPDVDDSPPRVSVWPNVVQPYSPEANESEGDDQKHLYKGLRPGEVRQLVFYGTIAKRKGAHLVLDALTTMYGDSRSPEDDHQGNYYPPALSVVFLGRDSNFGKQIDSTCAELPRVTCTKLTNYTRDDALAFLSSSSALAAASSLEVSSVPPLVIVPSASLENSPTVVLEAQDLGLPLVASETGGIPELVPDDQQYLLFKPTSSAIVDVISRVHSKGAPPASRKLDPKVVEEKWIDYLKRVANVGREANENIHKASGTGINSVPLVPYGVVITTTSSALEASLHRVLTSQEDSYPEFVVVALSMNSDTPHDEMETMVRDACKAVGIDVKSTNGSSSPHCMLLVSASKDDFLLDKAVNALPLAEHMLIADGAADPKSPHVVQELRASLARSQFYYSSGNNNGSTQQAMHVIPAVSSPSVTVRGVQEAYTGCGHRPTSIESRNPSPLLDPLGLYVNCYAYSSLFLVTSTALSAAATSSPEGLLSFRTVEPSPLPVEIDSATKWPLFATLATKGFGFVSPANSRAKVDHKVEGASPNDGIIDRHNIHVARSSLDVLRNAVAHTFSRSDSSTWSPAIVYTLSQSMGERPSEGAVLKTSKPKATPTTGTLVSSDSTPLRTSSNKGPEDLLSFETWASKFGGKAGKVPEEEIVASAAKKALLQIRYGSEGKVSVALTEDPVEGTNQLIRRISKLGDSSFREMLYETAKASASSSSSPLDLFVTCSNIQSLTGINVSEELRPEPWRQSWYKRVWRAKLHHNGQEIDVVVKAANRHGKHQDASEPSDSIFSEAYFSAKLADTTGSARIFGGCFDEIEPIIVAEAVDTTLEKALYASHNPFEAVVLAHSALGTIESWSQTSPPLVHCDCKGNQFGVITSHTGGQINRRAVLFDLDFKIGPNVEDAIRCKNDADCAQDTCYGRQPALSLEEGSCIFSNKNKSLRTTDEGTCPMATSRLNNVCAADIVSMLLLDNDPADGLVLSRELRHLYDDHYHKVQTGTDESPPNGPMARARFLRDAVLCLRTYKADQRCSIASVRQELEHTLHAFASIKAPEATPKPKAPTEANATAVVAVTTTLPSMCAKHSTCGAMSTSSLVVPLYVYPDDSTGDVSPWIRLASGLAEAKARASIILNYSSGNSHDKAMCKGSAPASRGWARLVNMLSSLRTSSSGRISLNGYVNTGRILDESTGKYIIERSSIQRAVGAIAAYADCYSVDGIFIDDVPTNPLPETQEIVAAARSHGLKVLLNPGTPSYLAGQAALFDGGDVVFDIETDGLTDGAAEALKKYEGKLERSSASNRGVIVYNQAQKHLEETLQVFSKLGVGHAYLTDVKYSQGMPTYWEELVCAFAPFAVCDDAAIPGLNATDDSNTLSAWLTRIE